MESFIQEKELSFEELNTIDAVLEEGNAEKSEVCVSACCHKHDV